MSCPAMPALAARVLRGWPLVVYGAALSLAASLAQATLVQPVPDGFFATVPKAWGQCRWEGGLGLSDACKLEDCPEDGGKADCTEPEIAPPNGRPWSDADADGFIYGMCDEAGPYVIRDRLWCESAGGTWNGPTDCANLPPVVVGGGGTMVKDESAADEFALEFETHIVGGCGITASPTPWAANTTSSWHCWNGPRVQRNGKILSDIRYTDYRSPQSGKNCDQGPVEERVYFRRDRDLACPVGYTRRDKPNGDLQCVRPMSDYCPTLGNPVAPISGAKLQTEIDYRAGGIGGLEFVRYYNSQGFFRTKGEGNEVSAMGERWRHTYQRSLHFYTDQTYALGAAKRPTGTVMFFDATGKEVHNRGGGAARLVAVNPPSGTPAVSWQLTLADDSVESYDANGRLLSIRTRAGLVTTLGWSGNKLTSVSDAFGHSLSLSYGADGRIQSVTQPDTQTLGYAYDGAGRLIFATYPGSVAREYHYELVHPYSYLLTGITDENGIRYATFTYSGGFATGTEHAGGVDKYQLQYNGASTTVTDPLGAVRNYAYGFANGVRKITGLSQPCASCGGGNTQAATYDNNGNVASRTDFNGNRTNYIFDAARNLETSRTEGLTSAGATTAVTRTISTTWHPTFRIPVTVTEPDGNGGSRVTTFTYDANGNLLGKTVAAGALSRSWSYTYDSYGRVLTEDGPRIDVSDVTTYAYYANTASCVACRGQLHTVTNALGHITTYSDYDANGRATRIVDPNGVVTAQSYHLRGWQTSRTKAFGTPLAEARSWIFDDAGLAIRLTRPDGSHIDYGYDDAHRAVGKSDALGNATSRKLNKLGWETEFSAFDALGARRATRGRVFDALNRRIQEVGAYGEVAKFGYDANNNPVAAIDADGGLHTTNFDALNRAVVTVDPQGGVVTKGLDATDRLRTFTDPGGLVTTYVYDGLGNQTSRTSPDTGLTQFSHDEAGNVIASTDARGITTTTTYDALNRPTQRTSGSGGSAVTTGYVYDQNAYGKGRVSSVSDAGSSVALAYDPLGRVTVRAETVGTHTLTTAYDYENGLLSTVTYPSGMVVSYKYDSAGRASELAIDGNPLIERVGYVPFGEMDGFTFSHGSVVERRHGLDGRIDRLTLAPGSLTTTATAYDYDALNRITRAQLPGNLDYRFEYDATGNRQSMSLNSTTTEYDYVPNTHRLDETTGAGATVYGYDAAGNTTTRGSDTLTYDARGRLVGHGGGAAVSYVVNPVGVRVAKQTAGGSTYFAYDSDGVLLGEYSGDSREYVYLNGLLVGAVAHDSKGSKYYAIYSDHLGTPRSVERIEDASLVWRWPITGAVFGEDNTMEIWEPGSGGSPFTLNLRFPGQYFDAESGLHYNYFRDYDPSLGRYAQSDPIGLQGGPSTYGYVGQDPLSFVDPSGLVRMAKCDSCDNNIMIEAERSSNEWCQERVLKGVIKDTKLRNCIKKRCESTEIVCDPKCPKYRCGAGPDDPNARVTTARGHSQDDDPSKITLCISEKPAAGGWGSTTVHEFSHTCRTSKGTNWNHGDDMGVPNDPGPDPESQSGCFRVN